MKVALVAEWLDAWRGGAETSTLQFLHHLTDQGVEVHLFTRSRPSPRPGVFVHTISGASMSRTRRSMTFTHRVDRLIGTQAFDVVHAITPCRGATVYQPRGGTVVETMERNVALLDFALARHLKRCANRFNLKQRYARALERELLLRSDGPIVIALSDYVIRQLKQHYALPDERIRKIFNGVDLDTTSPEQRARQRKTIRGEYGIEEQDCLILLIAHNFRLKGVQRWMEALALLLRRGQTNVRSLVIGRGDTERWHRLAAKLDLKDHLTFTGPSDRVREFLHAGDVLVHPTYYDPCSRVVLEAMVTGLPCVTTRWDGASEVIADGENGFVLEEPHDVAALADRVERLLEAGFRKRMGEAARGVSDRVSMKRHAEQMVALYESLTAKGGGRG